VFFKSFASFTGVTGYSKEQLVRQFSVRDELVSETLVQIAPAHPLEIYIRELNLVVRESGATRASPGDGILLGIDNIIVRFDCYSIKHNSVVVEPASTPPAVEQPVPPAHVSESAHVAPPTTTKTTTPPVPVEVIDHDSYEME